MNIITHQSDQHRFILIENGNTAYLAYRLFDGGMDLVHTVVPETLSGRGIGGNLAKTALDYARRHGLQIKPTCPFIARYLTKHPEYRDLLAE